MAEFASEYRAQVVAELRRRLLHPDGRAKTLASEGRVVVADVRLEGPLNEGILVVVLYRDVRRPGCLLGWRTEATETEDEPEIWTTVVWANLRELVIGSPHGSPAECSEEGITRMG